MNDSSWNTSELHQAIIDMNETSEEYLLTTGLSSVFLATDLTFLIPNFYFHYLIIRMVSREKKKKAHILMKNVLRCYAVIVPVTHFYIFCMLIYSCDIHIRHLKFLEIGIVSSLNLLAISWACILERSAYLP